MERSQLPQPTGRKKAFIAAAALVVLVGAGILVMRKPHKNGGAAAGVKRVAVLPFENLGSPEDDYFADGMADEIRGKLTSLPSVQVIARASSTPYKKTTKTPNQIAQELDVGYLLTATVRWEKSGGSSRVHVSPELVEVSGSGAPTSRWQQPFDAALTDVFQVQSDIASRVALALGVALGAGEEKRLSEKPTQNLAAYDAFLKGEELRSGGNFLRFKKALGFYEQAVALDPGFTEAWAWISVINSHIASDTPEGAERARQAAEKAVVLAPDRPEGYLALGDYQNFVRLDFTRALEQYARGLRLAPGNANLVMETGLAELRLGRWDAAVEHFRQAAQLDPFELGNAFSLCGALNHLRRYSEAREATDRGLALAPTALDLIRCKVDDIPGGGQSRRRSRSPQGRAERGRAHSPRGSHGERR